MGRVEGTADEENEYVVEAVVGVRVLDGDLEWRVKWEGWPSSENTWEKHSKLSCRPLVGRFVLQHQSSGEIPRPGDVDLVMGGPPCQVTSGACSISDGGS